MIRPADDSAAAEPSPKRQQSEYLTLADLGLARSVPRAGHTVSKWGASKGKLTAETGSFRWMAPEVSLTRTPTSTPTRWKGRLRSPRSIGLWPPQVRVRARVRVRRLRFR